MDAIRWSEAEGFEAHERGLRKVENPHRRPSNPTSPSLLAPEARAQLAAAWDQGWDRASVPWRHAAA